MGTRSLRCIEVTLLENAQQLQSKAYNDDDDFAFLISLMPIIETLGTDQKLQFWMGTMQLLNDIRRHISSHVQPTPTCLTSTNFKCPNGQDIMVMYKKK
jgi:hypothetical protein